MWIKKYESDLSMQIRIGCATRMSAQVKYVHPPESDNSVCQKEIYYN